VSALDIIEIVWRCVEMLLMTAVTVFVGFCCIGVPIVWDKLEKIDGALRCIDIDLAAIHGDLEKPKKQRYENDEH
jgi:hypothetical protein